MYKPDFTEARHGQIKIVYTSLRDWISHLFIPNFWFLHSRRLLYRLKKDYMHCNWDSWMLY